MSLALEATDFLEQTTWMPLKWYLKILTQKVLILDCADSGIILIGEVGGRSEFLAGDYIRETNLDMKMCSLLMHILTVGLF